MNNIKFQSVTAVVIGLISAVGFGYYGSQKLGALTTGVMGTGFLGGGAVMLVFQKYKPQKSKFHVHRGVR
ncbi:hypothetical protein [aff. Roholtiella sp. LEGE 12411]|uniref:hypothetical protein n=1 Tax=aff. Roholtiella sp. LEGE 12411 TaxID=1828822 RepID=UPI00187F188B|nr:hypothetical protein [aff. Roholtiella sp. LEGE 12411]MBE9036963.1 hypothetical protein [aff. Roholtiella sp. LEGE 12411]